jgi:hypothetical protein
MMLKVKKRKTSLELEEDEEEEDTPSPRKVILAVYFVSFTFIEFTSRSAN